MLLDVCFASFSVWGSAKNRSSFWNNQLNDNRPENWEQILNIVVGQSIVFYKLRNYDLPIWQLRMNYVGKAFHKDAVVQAISLSEF